MSLEKLDAELLKVDIAQLWADAAAGTFATAIARSADLNQCIFAAGWDGTTLDGAAGKGKKEYQKCLRGIFSSNLASLQRTTQRA